jgi:hypothetical protein
LPTFFTLGGWAICLKLVFFTNLYETGLGNFLPNVIVNGKQLVKAKEKLSA